MIYLDTNDFFLKNILSNILTQLGFQINSTNINSSFENISVYCANNYFIFDTSSSRYKLNIPTNILELKNIVNKILSNIKIELENISYIPSKSQIHNGTNDIYLKDTHNLIFSYLLLNRDGINKIDLYGKIWPNDKNIQINKLDTHLTNLKNYLQESGLKIKFISNNGILILEIN